MKKSLKLDSSVACEQNDFESSMLKFNENIYIHEQIILNLRLTSHGTRPPVDDRG